jgi:DNA-binding transcriptional ArsR family regulator
MNVSLSALGRPTLHGFAAPLTRQKQVDKPLYLLLFNYMVTKHAARRSTFDAISDPTRRSILDHLRTGEMGAGDLARRFPVSRPAIARHVRVLRQAGLLKERRQAQQRFYSLDPAGLAEVDRWLQPYRLFWAARMTDLKAFVETSEREK